MSKLVFILLVPCCVIVATFCYTLFQLHQQISGHISSTLHFPNWKTQTKFVQTTDGYKIAYQYFPVENAQAVVILVHGHSNPGGKEHMLYHADYLSKAGYSIVIFDLRGFGESSGDKTTLGVNEWKDLEAVYDEMKRLPENENKHIGFFGISLGGVVAINTQALTHKGDFIIASVPFADFDSLFDYQIKNAGFPPIIFKKLMKLAATFELGKEYEKITPSNLISQVTVPILFISASNDTYVNPNDSVSLYEKTQSEKEIWKTDAGHDVYGEKRGEFQRNIIDFLNQDR